MKFNNSISILFNLLKLIKPLFYIMIVSIIAGAFSILCSTIIMVLGVYAVLPILGYEHYLNIISIFIIIIVLAILKGFFKYIEQLSGHYIAFKILNILRNKVFNAIRKLPFSQLDNKIQGKYVSLITNDIEILEVFYAHTIAPIIIAIICSTVYVLFLSFISIWLGMLALVAYLFIGFILPIIFSRKLNYHSEQSKKYIDEINNYLFESIRGIKEIILFFQHNIRLRNIKIMEKQLIDIKIENNKVKENLQFGVNLLINIFNFLMLITIFVLYLKNIIEFKDVLISMILFVSSYLHVILLCNLQYDLSKTIASGKRILEVINKKTRENINYLVKKDKRLNTVSNLSISNLYFSYGADNILSNINFELNKGDILGIYGPSGSGKSTLLKLIMNFYHPTSGEIKLDNININELSNDNLYDNISFIGHNTYIFNENILTNILLANRKATKNDIIQATENAALHKNIIALPLQYKTKISELGNNLSDGEKQRIALARAFLHNSSIILLDEPTCNLDSLNESIILKSLQKCKKNKIIIIVSHKKSTLSICNKFLHLDFK